jgi:hypothetical protein
MKVKRRLLLPTLLLTLLTIWVMHFRSPDGFTIFVSSVFWPVFWVGNELSSIFWLLPQDLNLVASGLLQILILLIVIGLVALESYVIFFAIAWLMALLKRLRR